MREAPFLPGTNNQIWYFSLFIIVYVEAGFSQIQSHIRSSKIHNNASVRMSV